ncbi:dihydroxyacetone kinase subunit DhaL [Pseudogemmobacter bohemicus]|uniref:dihydroxyacetone kinase subunit DhaL n=1 Tax=Pseudogemmobacter bohemicus TaxID=2250708 RepID=UPI000DD49037|nr:dihydroxyacetone kinase subunit DhaL [Pseudogemmobacter bohemicus]
MRVDDERAAEMLLAVARAVLDRVDDLTDADLAIGDGDHGIGMRRGFEAVELVLENPPSGIDGVFKAAGMAIMSNTGGAAGAVFGSVFTSGAAAFAAQEEITPEGFVEFLTAAQGAVQRRGGVAEGAKTMLDALAPAARAAAGASDLKTATAAAAEAALQGVEATKAMIATTGKARSLGERSVGHPDPGAISMSIILGAMRDYVAG